MKINASKNKLRTTFFFIVLALILNGLGGCVYHYILPDDYNDKTIALTFDDGPDPVYTDKILNILNEKEVKATFFALGKKIEQNKQVAIRIVQEGHCLANHTYDHINLETNSYEAIRASILKTEVLIESICGQSTKLFRPPWGKISKVKSANLNESGYKVVLWNIDSKDYESQISSDQIIENVLNGLKTKHEKIILLHDSDFTGKSLRINTVRALPLLIDQLKEMGYNFITVSEIPGYAQYNP